jgi:hypothetical protein
VVPEELLQRNAAVANRVDDGQLHPRLWAAANPPVDVPYEHMVRDVDEVFNRFERLVVPRATNLLKVAHDRVATNVRSRLWPALRRSQDDVGLVQLTKGFHVSGVPCIEGGSRDLHVLLRHRPRSIPQLQESA